MDCIWGTFDEWGVCSKPCGNGTMSRTREIIKEANYGGNPCHGNKTQYKDCHTKECSGQKYFSVSRCCNYYDRNLYSINNFFFFSDPQGMTIGISVAAGAVMIVIAILSAVLIAKRSSPKLQNSRKSEEG